MKRIIIAIALIAGSPYSAQAQDFSQFVPPDIIARCNELPRREAVSQCKFTYFTMASGCHLLRQGEGACMAKQVPQWDQAMRVVEANELARVQAEARTAFEAEKIAKAYAECTADPVCKAKREADEFEKKRVNACDFLENTMNELASWNQSIDNEHHNEVIDLRYLHDANDTVRILKSRVKDIKDEFKATNKKPLLCKVITPSGAPQKTTRK